MPCVPLRRLLTFASLPFLLLALLIPASAANATVAPDAAVAVPAAVRSCSSATPVASRPTLNYKDTGSCVKLMQQLLLNKAYKIGASAPTGNYLSGTKAAVLLFQKNNRLVADAVVGPKTWAVLASSKTPKFTSPVYLTFDDCPSGPTSTAARTASNTTLKTARDLGMHLRLYVTGDCLKAKRFDVAYARQMGHTVCSHTNTHPELTKLTLSQIKAELQIPGLTTNCARPPYGAVNTTVRTAFSQLGYRLDLWNVDTNDWRGKTQTEVTNYVIANARPGDVVLMHMNHKAYNSSALKAIKAGLSKKSVNIK